jgi:hypothetical protein
VFSWTYAEPKDVFGAYSALSFPNFFPKFLSRFCLLAVDEQASSLFLPSGGSGLSNCALLDCASPPTRRLVSCTAEGV